MTHNAVIDAVNVIARGASDAAATSDASDALEVLKVALEVLNCTKERWALSLVEACLDLHSAILCNQDDVKDCAVSVRACVRAYLLDAKVATPAPAQFRRAA